MCHRMGLFEEARRTRETILEALEARGYSEYHPEVLDAKTNLAHSYLYGSMLRRKKALELHRHVMNSELQHAPEDHPRMLLAKENYAWSLIMEKTEEGRHETSAVLRQVLDLRTRLSEEQTVLTIKTRIKYAVSISYSDHSQGCHELNKCLAQASRLASDKGARLWAMQELANAYYQKGDQPSQLYRALTLRIYIYEERLTEIGPGVPRLAINTRQIAEVLEEFCCWQTALPFRSQVVQSFATRGALDDECL
jgi:predicted RNA-binding protein Jag